MMTSDRDRAAAAADEPGHDYLEGAEARALHVLEAAGLIDVERRLGRLAVVQLVNPPKQKP